MKITLLVNQDFPALLSLNVLLPLISKHKVSVLATKQVGKLNSPPKELALLAALDQKLQLLRPKLGQTKMFGFEDLAKMGIPMQQVTSVRKPRGRNKLAETEPDLILSIRFGAILDDAAVCLSKFGVLNLHSGILPEFRGVMATFWSMLAGSQQLGSTLHWIQDSGIDTGDILFVDRLPINQQHCYFTNVLRLYISALPQVSRFIALLDKGMRPSSSVQRSGGNYCSYPSQNDIEEFLGNKLKLFDQASVLALLSAYSPASGE